MSTKYIAKCFKCLQFYEDANQRDSYKDSLISRFVCDFRTGKVIRCCPYCDEISIAMVSIPEYKSETYSAYRWNNVGKKR